MKESRPVPVRNLCRLKGVKSKFRVKFEKLRLKFDTMKKIVYHGVYSLRGYHDSSVVFHPCSAVEPSTPISTWIAYVPDFDCLFCSDLLCFVQCVLCMLMVFALHDFENFVTFFSITQSGGKNDPEFERLLQAR